MIYLSHPLHHPPHTLQHLYSSLWDIQQHMTSMKINQIHVVLEIMTSHYISSSRKLKLYQTVSFGLIHILLCGLNPTHYSLAPCSNTGQVQVLTRKWNIQRANTLPVSYHITVQHTLCFQTKPFTHPTTTLTHSAKCEWQILTVQPGLLPIHIADLGVGVFDGGVVVWYEVGLWDTLSVNSKHIFYFSCSLLSTVCFLNTWLFLRFLFVSGSIWKVNLESHLSLDKAVHPFTSATKTLQ